MPHVLLTAWWQNGKASADIHACLATAIVFDGGIGSKWAIALGVAAGSTRDVLAADNRTAP